MSWLPIPPLPNPFKSSSDDPQPSTSSVGKTLIRNVSNFLAPPPTIPSDNTPQESPSQTLIGIKNDLAEITGSFKSAVTGMSKLASNLLFKEGGGGGGGGGGEVSDGIIQFVEAISGRPQLWTDFPMSLEAHHSEFEISDMQREHISTIERLVPNLASLRLNICSNMIEGQFWMIYFILLLPRLNDHDFELLSTPEIVETRNILLQKLQNKGKAKVNTGKFNTVDPSQGDSNSTKTLGNSPYRMKVLADSVTVSNGESISDLNNIQHCLEEDADRHTSLEAQKPIGNETDVSFSDVEDDENDVSTRLSGLSLSHDVGNSSHGSSEWVKLKGSNARSSRRSAGQSTYHVKDSEGEESSDWLTVDDFDSDSLGTM